jgi:oligopeptide/dipeptide ABC transporter ATP-binding protein
MEFTTVQKLVNAPIHPYTKGLINSIPRIDKNVDLLEFIEGEAPNCNNMPPGCPFCLRCRFAQSKCFTQQPNLKKIEEDHSVSCFL